MRVVDVEDGQQRRHPRAERVPHEDAVVLRVLQQERQQDLLPVDLGLDVHGAVQHALVRVVPAERRLRERHVVFFFLLETEVPPSVRRTLTKQVKGQ